MSKLSVRLVKHYLPVWIISIIIGIIFYFQWPKKDLIGFITDSSGYIAIVIIVITLMIGPINIILNRHNPTSSYFRRDISISAGILTIIHSGFGLFAHLRGNMWQYFLNKTELGYGIRLDNFGIANYTGLLSTFFIIILLVTSNNYSIKKLKANIWKNIQRFAYLMFVLAIIHVIYYRIVLDGIVLIYYLYIPLLSIVIVFQISGIFLRLRGK